MNKKSSIVFLIILLPGILMVPAFALFGAEARYKCVSKKVSSRGHGGKTESLAHLDAVGEWLNRAQNIGEDVSFWHNAADRKVTCIKLRTSGYYHCRAFGTPCKRLARSHEKEIALPPKSFSLIE